MDIWKLGKSIFQWWKQVWFIWKWWKKKKNNVKRRNGERLRATCTKKTVKFEGGSVMVFGMFSSQGTTPLVRLQTRVNAQIYKNIVQDHVVPIIQNSGFDRATFMQDNAPYHKAKVVMSYLSEQYFEIMDWPPQSPDLNPIENLWKTLGVKVMERNPTNTEDLWVKLQEEWSKISIMDCQELIRSCSPTTSQILTILRILEGVRAKNLQATLIFVDFTKAFDSIHRGKMEQILLAYGIPKETVAAITILYRNTKVKVRSPDGDTEYFDIVAGVLQGDTLCSVSLYHLSWLRT